MGSLDHGRVLELLVQTPKHRRFDQVKPALAAKNPHLAQQLWERSTQLAGVRTSS